MFYVELILIGLSLSIDSFSLALSVGLNGIKKNKIFKYSLLVGLFHFIMPIIGNVFKNIISKIVYIPNKELFIGTLIFIIIGIILDKDDKKTIINPLLFAFSVSLDSFTVGLGLEFTYLFKAGLIFSVISSCITYIGFLFSSKLKEKFQQKSKYISIIILLMIIIYNIFQM